MALWVELKLEFTEAHIDPIDEELIGQIYDYASWCLTAREGDTATAAVVAFYEYLPVEPRVREQMAKWLSAEEFSGLTEVFRYFLSDEEHAAFIREFYEQRDRLRRTHKKLP
jgi:hypothetical protein